MGNINYTLGKDFLVFTTLKPDVSYYLQSYSGLGLDAGDLTSSSPYGPIYNPGNTIIYNTFSPVFVIDEDWKVFEDISNLAIYNAPVDGSEYNPVIGDIDLHLMNNTYQKEVGYIRMYNAYINNIQNVENRYNTEDNTIVKTLSVIIKYQYHKFFRTTNE